MNLALTTSRGRVLVLNGRGCYSDIEAVTAADVLDQFDRYAEWVVTGNRRNECDVSPAARARVLAACRRGEELLKLPVEDRIAMFEADEDPVVVVGGVS